jgi:hypothetical protein
VGRNGLKRSSNYCSFIETDDFLIMDKIEIKIFVPGPKLLKMLYR